MDTETARGLLFCRPRPSAPEEFHVGNAALLILPVVLTLFALALVAQEAARRGDVARTILIGRIASGLGLAVLVPGYAAVLVLGYRRKPLGEPLTARASVNWSRGPNLCTRGVLSLEDGALAFHGERFDFRLPPEILARPLTVEGLIGPSVRPIRLPLPKAFGTATLRIAAQCEDRAALEALLAAMRPGATPVLPPVYPAGTELRVRGGWLLVALMAGFTGAIFLLEGRFQAAPIGALDGGVLGWMHGPGLAFIPRLLQRRAERAFRRFQEV